MPNKHPAGGVVTSCFSTHFHVRVRKYGQVNLVNFWILKCLESAPLCLTKQRAQSNFLLNLQGKLYTIDDKLNSSPALFYIYIYIFLYIHLLHKPNPVLIHMQTSTDHVVCPQEMIQPFLIVGRYLRRRLQGASALRCVARVLRGLQHAVRPQSLILLSLTLQSTARLARSWIHLFKL